MSLDERRELSPRKHFEPARLLKRAEYYTIGSICLTIGALAAVVAAGNPEQILRAFAKADAQLIAGVCALSLVHFFFRVLRFQFSARCLGMSVPLGPMAMVYVAGFSMIATPGKVGELIRIWLLKRRFGFGYRRGLPLVIADRVVDLLAILGLCAAGLGAFKGHSLGVALSAVILIVGTVVLARPRLSLAIVQLAYRMVGRRPRVFVRLRQTVRSTALLFKFETLTILLALGLVGWLAETAGVYWCLSVLTEGISFQTTLFAFLFALLVGNLTFLPGGVGSTEITMIALLISAGIDVELAVAVTVLVRLCTLWFAVGLGFIAFASVLRSL